MKSANALDIDVGDGLSLHVAISGHGPPVILLHGFTGSIGTWDRLRDTLSRSYEVIAVDMPGHGRSSAPGDPDRYSLDRFASDLLQVVDTIGRGQVALLGYSMGGRAALRFAMSHADRVAGMILESTSPGIREGAERAARIAADAELAKLIETRGVTAFVDRWERLSLWESQRSLPAERLEALRAVRIANRPAGLANSLRGAGAGDDAYPMDRLATLGMPTLLIAGALDGKYVDLGTLMAESIPRAELRVIPEAGHMVHFDKPDEFASAVSRFLERLFPLDSGAVGQPLSTN